MDINLFLESVITALSMSNLVAAVTGTIIGLIIGVLPGLGTVMAVSLLMPLTFTLNPDTALIMLAAIYGGGVAGGSISSILLRTPGTAGSAATAIDGYEMAQNGQGSKAIGTSMISSLIGGIFGALVLLVLGGPMSKISVLFGPVEYFWFAIFGLTAMAGLGSKSVLKGVMMGILGLFLGTVGMDPFTGTYRFTFNKMELVSGLSVLPIIIGLFSVSQVFYLLDQIKESNNAKATISFKDILPSLKDLCRMKFLYLKSSLIGTIIGILPGAGAEVSSWVAYREAKRSSKTPEKFGKGIMEGVAAPECANNATVSASLIPLLTLGIPGSATAAVMFGALLIHDLTPGLTLFTEKAEVTYTFIVGMIIANILMATLGIIFAKWAAKIVSFPNELLGPLIINLCFIGTFAASNNLFDIYVAFVFGVLGYVLRKADFDGAPAILGVVLGPLTEKGFRQALVIGQGQVGYFFYSNISKILILLAIFSLLTPYIPQIKEKCLKLAKIKLKNYGR